MGNRGVKRGVIVAKIKPGAEAKVAEIFAKSDQSDLPGLAGVQHRSLFLLDDAVTHLSRVTTLEPEDAEAWHDLAVALVNEGRMGDASDAFRNALRLRPDDARALVNLGHTAYALGQSAEAVEHLRDAAKQK